MKIKFTFFYITLLYSLNCYSNENNKIENLNNKSDICKGAYIGNLEKSKKLKISITCNNDECWINNCTKKTLPKPIIN